MSIVTEILTIRVLAYFAESSGIRNGVIVSSLDSGSSGPGSCPDRGYCAVFFGQDTSFHLMINASVHISNINGYPRRET